MNAANKRTIYFAIGLLLMTCMLPAVAAAASVEMTESVKTSFDKLAAKADAKLKSKLTAQYGELTALQKKDTEWEAKIKTLHDRNSAEESQLRKQIREIDAAKLSKLDAEVKKTKERYEPLFTAYTALNKKIEAARALKNKDLNAILRLQAETMKMSVQLARLDIKNKETALKAAKDNASKTMKKIRDTLAGIDPIREKIKTEKSAAGASKKSIAPVWSNFKATLKKDDAKIASDVLATLVTLSGQIAARKSTIHELEQKVSDTIAKARSQLPK